MSYKIYRIEHPEDGYGLFRYPDVENRRPTAYSYIELYDCRNRHVDLVDSAYRDISNFEEGITYCAFPDMKTLRLIFKPEDLKFIVEHNFRILKLTVSEIQLGNRQVGYKKENVISISDISNQFK